MKKKTFVLPISSRPDNDNGKSKPGDVNSVTSIVHAATVSISTQFANKGQYFAKINGLHLLMNLSSGLTPPALCPDCTS